MKNGNYFNLSFLPIKFLEEKRTVDLREILNAIFYLLRAGCQWRDVAAMTFQYGKRYIIILAVGEKAVFG